MTTQTQIRQTFASQLGQLTEATDAWLIKGDFDRFKLINDLYGCLLTDTILDWAIEAIEATLESAQKRLGSGSILWNVVGDDVTIYIPPSTLLEGDVMQLLQSLRSAVRESFRQRYAVCALPFPPHFFTDVPPALLEELKNDLEQHDIVIDFSPRQQGCLVLFPLLLGRKRDHIASDVSVLIQRCLGKRIPAIAAQWDWVRNPVEQAGYMFNDGLIYPPSISFAGCSARRVVQEKAGDAYCCFERLSCACQSALKICKQKRCGVLLNAGLALPSEIPFALAAPPVSGAHTQMRWASERCLREKLYFCWLEQPGLFQINPVYHFASGAHAECLSMEKYRGNAHGVGLKGINELCGQSAADAAIRRLILVFAEALQDALGQKGIPLEQPLTALFVDRFTVFAEQPIFSLPELVALSQRLLTDFNDASDEIKVAHLRVSMADSRRPMAGYELLNRLTFTQLSTNPAALAYSDECLEVRRFCEAAAQEGSQVVESNALASARQLADYGGYSLKKESPLVVANQRFPTQGIYIFSINRGVGCFYFWYQNTPLSPSF
jgi:GGDEF domain-containing protein